MPWQWNAKAKRYKNSDTGKFLSNKRARQYVDESIAASGNVTETMAAMVRGDPPKMSPQTWRQAMRREIKDEYLRQYLLGRGGVGQMTPADWGSIGGMLKKQYTYLDRFGHQVDLGQLSEHEHSDHCGCGGANGTG